MRLLLAAFLFAFGGIVTAAAKTIGDCEKIADPDSYNRCLADFGPAAPKVRGEITPSAKTGEDSVPASVKSGSPTKAVVGRAGRGRIALRGRGGGGKSFTRSGRVRMSIPVGGSRYRGYRGRRR